ncbi:MAG TPA: aminotransferase class I/II-fold pyridoxal phosphate-dependent enzyme [Aggregatilineales bacterium]|nr:aminotransferase class I/II-fold pyridoxal phosphate-dependent enzyme [Aggregatilineales bacterium]
MNGMNQGLHGYDDIAVDELRQRRSKKWSTYTDDVLPAWIAEMDFPLSPVIRAALIAGIDRMQTGYIPTSEVSCLSEACAAWLQRSFRFDVEAAQIQIIPDVTRGIELAIHLFSRSESPVVLITPAYPSFFEVIRIAGRSIVEVPMTLADRQYVLDLDAIQAALRSGASTIILCNPYNPLGRVFGTNELAALSEIVERHRARVIVDEVYAPIVYPSSTHISYAMVSEAASRHSVTLTSAAKGWNIAGLKCAQIVLTNPLDLEIWNHLPAERSRGAGILGILANRVAYEEGVPWLETTVEYLDENRTLLAELLARHLPAIRYTIPEGTYLAWLDCREMGLDDPAQYFLDYSKVALNSGAKFGSPGVGHVRLNFATSRSILTEIVERMSIGNTCR